METTTFDDALRRSPGATDEREELSHDDITSPMRDIDWVARCQLPRGVRFGYWLAIRRGCAAGVTVKTSPRSPEIEACIDHELRGLHWKVSDYLDTYSIAAID